MPDAAGKSVSANIVDDPSTTDATADATAIPDLTDEAPPTPVEIILENSLEQVTAAAIATTIAQSGPSLDIALGSETNTADNAKQYSK
jgi:hypothetical protein